MKEEKENLETPIGLVKLIENWSKTFDLPIKKEEGFPDQSRIDLSIRLINEELKETKDAIAEGNFKETKDGLGDLLWVTVRAMMEMGIDPQETIERIYKSNMSKADSTIEEAIQTYKYYMEQGIPTYSKERNGVYITYRSSDNKLLKGRNFKEPEL